MIYLQHVTKTLRRLNGSRNTILRDISHHFRRGERTGILGLRGSGKSTLIDLLCGKLQPDSGKVLRTCRVSWPLGFSIGFYTQMTGRENLRFASRIYGADIKKVMNFVEDFSELGKALNLPLSAYSSAMRLKLAFGLSMAIDFDLYLIDEGYRIGDRNFRRKCDECFQQRLKNASCIIASSQTSLIKRYCSRIMILHEGHFMSFPTADQTLEAYEALCQHSME
ncbi:MAG: ATP-binding cassette domain-containing protein [Desulfovibrionaceae bacterium]|nr:ATP-binding cassette domain-containing protein [Desulfovibrionaceae bacterium]